VQVNPGVPTRPDQAPDPAMMTMTSPQPAPPQGGGMPGLLGQGAGAPGGGMGGGMGAMGGRQGIMQLMGLLGGGGGGGMMGQGGRVGGIGTGVRGGMGAPGASPNPAAPGVPNGQGKLMYEYLNSQMNPGGFSTYGGQGQGGQYDPMTGQMVPMGGPNGLLGGWNGGDNSSSGDFGGGDQDGGGDGSPW
jgi:hypothetical protein